MPVKLCVDWSGMVYLPTGSLGWFWSSAAWPPTFLFVSFSTLYSSSLWRTATIVFSKLNNGPLPNMSPLKRAWNIARLKGRFMVFGNMNIDDPPFSIKLLCLPTKLLLNHLKNKPSFLANLKLVAMCLFPWDGPLNRFLTKYGLFEVWFGLQYFYI